jgi:uncharacterized protein (DUF1330 family)
MKSYQLGDIVRTKSSSTGDYYMIVGVEDASTQTVEGKFITDFDYEIAKIYPVQKESEFSIISHKKLAMVATTSEKDNRIILDFVNKERQKRGWYDEPDYITALQVSKGMSTKKLTRTVKDKDGNKSKEEVGMKKFDTIRYDKLKTVNECLDALNDLKDLHKNFGDEAYLQLKEIVEKQLKSLVKK